MYLSRGNEVFRAEDPSPVTHAFIARALGISVEHPAIGILFIGNIANVNATPSHKWFDCEFTY